MSLVDLLCDEEDKKNEFSRADYVVGEQLIIDSIMMSSGEMKRRVFSYLERWIRKQEIKLPTGNISVRELIQIAANKTFSENKKSKHNSKAKYGWYRYDTRFAVPKYNNDGELTGYNIFKGRMVIRHAQDNKLYLYDILRIKKETSEPLE